MKDLSGLEYLGKIYINKGEWQKAYTSLKKYIDWLDSSKTSLLGEEISYLYSLAADCRVELNNFSSAQDLYLTAIDLAPLYRRPYFKLGLLYEKFELYTEEVAILEKALKVTERVYLSTAPEEEDMWNSSILNHLAYALFNLGDYVKAAGYLAFATIQFPGESFSNELRICEEAWGKK